MFIIQTDMTIERHSQPLFWNGNQVVGICRANEAAVYQTRDEAEADLAALAPRYVRFYDLVVIEQKKSSRLPNIGGNGWMKGHPGYDLA
jgi:hypothetical protein